MDIHVRNMELGKVYVNKLIPEEKVIIEDMESHEMWGQTCKENITIVKYKAVGGMKANTGFGGRTTLNNPPTCIRMFLSNFLMKYEDTQTNRDNKLNQILG